MRNAFTRTSKLLLYSLMILGGGYAHAISVTASARGTLPPDLVESSGLDYTGGTHFWSLNDSGDPKIFRIADDGSLTRTVTITNALNRNWEDLAHDAARTHLFIGDFGNNNCDRTNLRVYKIPYPSTIAANTIAAELISFTYQDQHQFPARWMNFDVEAFLHFQGQLFLFTKADGSAVGYTKMYTIPDVAGSYVAMLVDSFYTNDRTTGATISPDGTSMVLISNTHIHLFRNFVGNDFFHGTHTQINIAGGWTQKEAVSFGSNTEIYLTDENTGGGNHLYYIDLSSFIPPPASTLSVNNLSKDDIVSIYPNPANDHLNIVLKNVTAEKISISIFDMTGKLALKCPVENSSEPIQLNTAILPTGVYFYRIYADAKEVQTSRLVVTH